MITLYDMTTFVCNCKTSQGALELAQYLERRFPGIPYQNAKPLRFNVILTTEGKVSVHSELPFNELGKADIKQAVADFVAAKTKSLPQRRPVQSVALLAAAQAVA